MSCGDFPVASGAWKAWRTQEGEDSLPSPCGNVLGPGDGVMDSRASFLERGPEGPPEVRPDTKAELAEKNGSEFRYFQIQVIKISNPTLLMQNTQFLLGLQSQGRVLA